MQGCFGPRCPGIPKHANTDALPPPDRTMWQYGKQIDHYTADQLRAAVAAERERMCAAIKAADDKAAEHDYMLDSDDCISVIRGTWNPGS